MTGDREDTPLVLSRRDARRVAARAQLLSRPRPGDVVETVTELTLLQIDPVLALAPAQHLVLWSRLGSSYDTGDLDRLLADRTLVEILGHIRPGPDIALYRAQMEAWPGAADPSPPRPWQLAAERWVQANDRARRDILAQLEQEGPTPTAALPDSTEVPWRSTGWTNDKNVQRLLDFMVARGEVAVAGREGGQRLWDLAARVYPDVPTLPLPQALAEQDARRLASLGLLRARGRERPVEPGHAGRAGVPAMVEGAKGTWRVHPAYLDGDRFQGRAALLCPIDRLIFDRDRMAEIFGFDYVLEMYKPRAKRRWGYYALPVLDGDELVGKLDATVDRRQGVLRVEALHEDGVWGDARRVRVLEQVHDLALWLGLDPELPAHLGS